MNKLQPHPYRLPVVLCGKGPATRGFPNLVYLKRSPQVPHWWLAEIWQKGYLQSDMPDWLKDDVLR